MINQITIRLNYGTDMDFPFNGKFVDKASRKRIYLLHDFRVLVDLEPTGNQKVFKYPFGKNNMTWTFEWDSNDKDKSEFAKWLKLHPLVKHADNKNADGQTYFILIDKSREDEAQFERENPKAVVYNMVKNLPSPDLREVAYLNMVDPGGKTPVQLFNILCGFDKGMLMQNPLKFIADWKASGKEKVVIIRKATMLGIIKTQTDGDKSIFLINNTPIGSIDNLVVYFNENPDQYKYLVKEVSEKDILPYGYAQDISVEEAILGTATKEPKKDTTLSAEVKDENKLQREKDKRDATERKNIQVNRLKELGVKGWAASAAWSEEVRLKKIAEAELVPA